MGDCGHTERDDRGCVECRRTRDRENKRRTKGYKPAKGGGVRQAEARQAHDHTRQILALYEQREREPRRWVRDEIEAQIARLRA